MKTILSLFDYTGNWARPYAEAGYDVVLVDIKHGLDVLALDHEWLRARKPHGILAGPPCTDFAGSGAQYWPAKDADGRTEASLALIRQTLAIVEFCQPAWWVLENPVGRLNRWLGKPRMYFHPWEFGDAYTKKTALWGEFNSNLRRTPVEPVMYTTSTGKCGSWYLGASWREERTDERATQCYADGLCARVHGGQPMTDVEYVSDELRSYRGVIFQWRGQEALAGQMAKIDRNLARAELDPDIARLEGEIRAKRESVCDHDFPAREAEGGNRCGGCGAVLPVMTATLGTTPFTPDHPRMVKTVIGVQFEVYGEPIPQGSHRSPRAGVVINDNPRLKAWRAAIVKACPRERIEGPVSVHAVFRFQRPKSSKREWPAVKPDLDKLVRALFDGITASGLWEDDSRVVRVSAEKKYGEPGVSVTVEMV